MARLGGGGGGGGGGGVLSVQEKKLFYQKRNFRISVILIKTFTAHVEQDTFNSVEFVDFM